MAVGLVRGLAREAVSWEGALTVEMALERVGLGPVVLAPNRRFMLLVCLKTWCFSKGSTWD